MQPPSSAGWVYMLAVSAPFALSTSGSNPAGPKRFRDIQSWLLGDIQIGTRSVHGAGTLCPRRPPTHAHCSWRKCSNGVKACPRGRPPASSSQLPLVRMTNSSGRRFAKFTSGKYSAASSPGPTMDHAAGNVGRLEPFLNLKFRSGDLLQIICEFARGGLSPQLSTCPTSRRGRQIFLEQWFDTRHFSVLTLPRQCPQYSARGAVMRVTHPSQL